jgi:aspartyl-tRNA(Asn)/glutamyl-tRNA(Gln) amidotransferase subunit B
MPDLRSPIQARQFLDELKLLLVFGEISDCNMERGNLRVDANVNLQIETVEQSACARRTETTDIVEIKNLNSFRAVQRSIEFEVDRQYQAWRMSELHPSPVTRSKQTRGWDDQSQTTVLQRQKEDSADYRYFPDPDLVAIHTPPLLSKIASIQQRQKSPKQWRDDLQREFGLRHYDAEVLVNQGVAVVEYFVELATAVGDGRLASKWVQQEVLRYLNDHAADISQFPVSVGQFAELLMQVKRGNLDTARARDVLGLMVRDQCSLNDAVRNLGIRALSQSELESLCQALIADNAAAVSEIRAGNTKAIGALIGQAKKRNANVDPSLLKQLLIEMIGS